MFTAPGQSPAPAAERAPRALVSNDDGYTAPGIRALLRCCQACGVEPVLCAPMAENSGRSCAISREHAVAYPVQGGWAVAGTPADTMVVGLACSSVRKPGSDFFPQVDFVLSGINLGGNMGDEMNLSGTLGVGVLANTRGYPAACFSLEEYRGADFEAAEPHVCEVIRRFVAELARAGQLRPGVRLGAPVREGDAPAPAEPFRYCEGYSSADTPHPTLWNVNIPPKTRQNGVRGYRFTRQGRAHLRFEFRPMEAPERSSEAVDIRFSEIDRRVPIEVKRRVSGSAVSRDLPETDVWAVAEGYVSITPMRAERVAAAPFGLEPARPESLPGWLGETGWPAGESKWTREAAARAEREPGTKQVEAGVTRDAGDAAEAGPSDVQEVKLPRAE